MGCATLGAARNGEMCLRQRQRQMALCPSERGKSSMADRPSGGTRRLTCRNAPQHCRRMGMARTSPSASPMHVAAGTPSSGGNFRRSAFQVEGPRSCGACPVLHGGQCVPRTRVLVNITCTRQTLSLVLCKQLALVGDARRGTGLEEDTPLITLPPLLLRFTSRKETRLVCLRTKPLESADNCLTSHSTTQMTAALRHNDEQRV